MTSHFKPIVTGFYSLEGIPQIARFTLHGSVLNQLRDMIIEGKLLPGMRLNESQLGQVLGVSRTPLREAIKSLAGEGLIEIRPARGAIVRVLSAEDIRNTLEVIALLEQGAGRMLCARGGVAALEELEALHRAMRAEHEKSDRLACFKLAQAFHATLMRLAGNPVLFEMHQMIHARVRRASFLGIANGSGWKDMISEHRAILDALRQGDAEKMAQSIATHLAESIRRAQTGLSAAG